MFYTRGIDITNDKQMFNFLKNHFEYWTMNSWNRQQSVANNVKLYRLNLSGNWCVALDLLNSGEYDTIAFMIEDWERVHAGYKVFFNGRSGGYLVLCNANNQQNVLPETVEDSDTYEDYKDWCREYYGSVKANRDELVFYTKLVQDFDKLCDTIRDYCDELSNLKFEFIEMDKAVYEFNERYEDDLFFLDFQKLLCNEEGKVDVSEISAITCLWEAFCSVADRRDSGYMLKTDENGFVFYAK